MAPKRIKCCVCGKQAVDWNVSIRDKHLTILKGAKAGWPREDYIEVFCGYCAIDLDENGLLPEEQYAAY